MAAKSNECMSVDYNCKGSIVCVAHGFRILGVRFTADIPNLHVELNMYSYARFIFGTIGWFCHVLIRPPKARARVTSPCRSWYSFFFNLVRDQTFSIT